jgi:hypothetical protein
LIKTFFVLFLLSMALLHARENPFFPASGEQDIPFTTNLTKELEPLKRATITLPAQARVLQNVTVSFKNLDGSIESKSIDLNHAVDWHLPLFISQSYAKEQQTIKPKEEKFQYLGEIKFAKFYATMRSFKIVTKDAKIRDFLLADPHKIVVDFKRDASLKTFSIANTKTCFEKVRVGNHSGYYRVVLELDGTYKYKSTKIKDGYLFEVY